MAGAYVYGCNVRGHVRILLLFTMGVETIEVKDMMRKHEVRHKVLGACWAKDFYVIVRPLGIGYSKKPWKVQLIMDLQGHPKVGEMTYEQNSKELEEKIMELYLYMYKNFVT
jgi:hypothetical protein